MSVAHSKPKPISSIKSAQQGVALLTILLLVVAITIIAGSMLASQRLMVRQYGLVHDQGQLREIALAGENLAVALLKQDSLANRTDSLQDSWAKPIPAFSIATGTVQIKIEDKASRFNINNLYHDGKADPIAINYFAALLQSHGINPNVAMAVLDWQDPDQSTSPNGGAEADYYQSLGKPMAMPIANQPFNSIEALQYVRGMDAQKLASIRPLITAVPYFLPMNVNTVQPALLNVLPLVSTTDKLNPTPPVNANNVKEDTAKNSVLDQAALTTWAATRTTAIAISDLDKFWSLPMFASLSADKKIALAPLFDVQSRAFWVTGEATLADKHAAFTSQIAKIIPTQQAGQSPIGLAPASQPDNSAIVAYHRQWLPL